MVVSDGLGRANYLVALTLLVLVVFCCPGLVSGQGFFGTQEYEVLGFFIDTGASL